MNPDQRRQELGRRIREAEDRLGEALKKIPGNEHWRSGTLENNVDFAVLVIEQLAEDRLHDRDVARNQRNSTLEQVRILIERVEDEFDQDLGAYGNGGKDALKKLCKELELRFNPPRYERESDDPNFCKGCGDYYTNPATPGCPVPERHAGAEGAYVKAAIDRIQEAAGVVRPFGIAPGVNENAEIPTDLKTGSIGPMPHGAGRDPQRGRGTMTTGGSQKSERGENEGDAGAAPFVWAAADFWVSAENIIIHDGLNVVGGVGVPKGAKLERPWAERHGIPFVEEEPPQVPSFWVLYAEGVSAKKPLGVYDDLGQLQEDAQKLWAQSDGYHSFSADVLELNVLYKPSDFRLRHSWRSKDHTDTQVVVEIDEKREPWRVWDEGEDD